MPRAVMTVWQRQPEPRVSATAGWGEASGLVAGFVWITVTAIGCVGDNDNLWRAGARSRAGLNIGGEWAADHGPMACPRSSLLMKISRPL